MLFGGTWVYVHFYSIHHQPEIWKNPEVLLLNECYIIHWKLSEKYALWVTWSCWAPMAAWFLYFPIKCMYIVAHYRIDYTCMRDPKAATPMLLCHSLLVQGNNSNVFHTIPCTYVFIYSASSVIQTSLVSMEVVDNWIVWITEIILNASINNTYHYTLSVLLALTLAWILLVWRKQHTGGWNTDHFYKMATIL